MAAYNADIQINVKGGKQVDALRQKVEELATKITDLTYTKAEISPKLLRQSQFFVEQERKLISARNEYNEGLRESVMLAVQFQQRMEAIARLAQQSRAQAAKTLKPGQDPAGLLPAQAASTPFRVAENKAARIDAAFAKLSAAAEGTTTELIRIGNEGKQFKALPEAGKATVNYFQIAETVAKQIDAQNTKTARVNRALDKLAAAAEGSVSNLVRVPEVFRPKGLLAGAPEIAGLLPAAGQTGGKPVTAVSTAYENLVSAQIPQTGRGSRFAEAVQREALRRADLGIGAADLPLDVVPGMPGVPFKGKPVAKAGGLPAKALTGLQAPGVMDAILGGGFPMLFGGGPGAVLGGAAGGFVGGQMGGIAGMALSIGLSAVGQKIDEAVQKVRELGDAINLLSIDKLRDSFIVVNAELDTTVRRLLEAGQAEEARAAMATQVAAQTGALGSAIQDSANASNLLGNAWTDLSGSVSSLLSMLAAPFAAALAGIVKIISMAVKGVNVIVSIVGGGLKAGIEAILTRLPGGKQLLEGIKNATQATNEELEKQKAALTATTDAAHRQLVTAMKLEQIDKQRTHVVTTLGKLINIEADRQAKIVNIRAGAEQKIIDLRLKYGNLTDAQSKKELEIAIKQVQAQAAIEIREANRAALRQRLVVLNEQLIAQDKLAQHIAANLAAVERARSQAKQQILNADIQGLQLQKQFALSLNEESAIIDKIASKKIAAANESYAQTAKELDLKVQLAAADLRSVEAAYKRGFATQEQVAQARSNLKTAVATRAELLKGAEATRAQAVAAANLERRQQNVAAFAADAARQTEAFNRAANEATNALNNRVKVSDALTQAALTINNIEIQSLQNKLAQAKTEDERVDILDDIRELEIANAALTLQATRTQIRAEVERQRIAMAMAEVKYRELQAVVELAAAQKVLTQSHLEALRAQASALRIARDNYATSVKVADAQMMAANAVYNASVNAANLRAQMEGTAAAAGAVAGAMDRVAAASAGGTTPIPEIFGEAGKNPLFAREWYDAVNELNRAANTVSSFNRAYNELLTRFLTKAQEFNQAKAAERMQSAAEDWITTTGDAEAGLSLFTRAIHSGLASTGALNQAQLEAARALREKYGLRNRMQAYAPSGSQRQEDGVMPGSTSTRSGAPSAINPQVSITTGPVMQMGNETYVTKRDLMSATQQAARQGANMALQTLQSSPSVRRNAGLAR